MTTNGSSPSRNDLRAKLLDTRNFAPKTEKLQLFGQDVELRQPMLADILDAREIADAKQRAVTMLIRYTVVPGTNERVFEEGDAEVLLQWPFGDDMVRFQQAIARLTGLDIDAEKEVLQKTPLGDASSSSAAS